MGIWHFKCNYAQNTQFEHKGTTKKAHLQEKLPKLHFPRCFECKWAALLIWQIVCGK